MRERESVRLTPALSCRHPHWSEHDSRWLTGECPRQDSNLRTRLRRPLLYPLSYGGVSGAELVARGDGQNTTSSLGVIRNWFRGGAPGVGSRAGWKWGKPGRGGRSAPTLELCQARRGGCLFWTTTRSSGSLSGSISSWRVSRS